MAFRARSRTFVVPLIITVGVSTFLSLVAGCWTLTSDFDLSSGNNNPADASSAAMDGSPAPSDAASEAEGSAGTGGIVCDGSERICDAFDVGALGSKWTQVATTGAGTATLDTSNVRSAPNAFVARLMAGCPGQDGAQLIDRAPGQPAELTLDFDVLLAPTGGPDTVQLAGIVYTTASGFYRIDVVYRDGHLELTENQPFARLAQSTKTFPFNAWRHIALTIVYVGATPRATVNVDGVTELTASISPPPPTNSQTNLDFGVYSDSVCPAAIEARFDNVVYRLKTR